jgi:hypothetical protein
MIKAGSSRVHFLYLETTILQFTSKIFVPIIPADVFLHICNFHRATMALRYLFFFYIYISEIDVPFF